MSVIINTNSSSVRGENGGIEVTALLMDSRTLRPFKSSEEYLYAMREDLAEWLHALYPDLGITVDLFMDCLEDGVALCKHANNVRKAAKEHIERKLTRSMSKSTLGLSKDPKWPILSSRRDVQYKTNAKAGTFLARDNVSNFISWCRYDLEILECLLFETDDLILRKNEKHVILCLMEVARRGAKFGVPAPMLVQFEREIDREIARDQKRERATTTSTCGTQAGDGLGLGDEDEEDEEEEEEDYPLEYGPVPQIITNDLKSLDEMVRELVEKCSCPTQFPMIRVSEGKYRIGDTKVLIFVRILRNHVMVRVGGGWDTLSHYLDKHDPCRCRAGHRSLLGSRLVTKSGKNTDLNTAQVHYERNVTSSPPRTRRSSVSSVGSNGTTPTPSQTTTPVRRPRSRSPRPPQQLSRRSRSPRPVKVQVTNTAGTTSDSGSEVGSDEGYRSLNNKLLVPTPADDEVDTTERPESAMTNTSDCSSSTPDELIPPTRRIIAPSTRRSASPCVRKDAVSSVRPNTRRSVTPSRDIPQHQLSRSRSASGEGNNLLNPKSTGPLSRTNVGYRSMRTNKPSTTAEYQNTWNGGQRSNKSRPALTNDTFNNPNPFGPPSTRRSLPTRSPISSTHSTPTRKPSSNKQQQQNKINASLPTSPTKHVSPILKQILVTSEQTQNEDEFLQSLRKIITQFEGKLQTTDQELYDERGPTPRKSSHDDNDTRIPVPTFYKQNSKTALLNGTVDGKSSQVTVDTTCCL